MAEPSAVSTETRTAIGQTPILELPRAAAPFSPFDCDSPGLRLKNYQTRPQSPTTEAFPSDAAPCTPSGYFNDYPVAIVTALEIVRGSLDANSRQSTTLSNTAIMLVVRQPPRVVSHVAARNLLFHPDRRLTCPPDETGRRPMRSVHRRAPWRTPVGMCSSSPGRVCAPG